MKKFEDLHLATSIDGLNVLAAKSNDIIKNKKFQQLVYVLKWFTRSASSLFVGYAIQQTIYIRKSTVTP